MKNTITVEKASGKLHFYLHTNSGQYYLCSQRSNQCVYDYFRKGRSENEVLSFHKWNQHPSLDKTISKLPVYIKYVRKEVAC